MRPWYALVLVCACAIPPGPMERLSGVALDLNAATRFGRMDLAQASVVPEARAEFGRRHRAWGKDVRIVDVDVEGVQLLPEGAEVDLTVSWHRIDETVIRSTTVAQKWVQGANEWKLLDETIAGGSHGLFPPVKKQKPKAAPEKEAVGSNVDLPGGG